MTGATGPIGPTGPTGIGVAYSVKKLFLNWIYPSNGTANSGSLITITSADFVSAVFSNKVYDKNLSLVSTIDYALGLTGMLLSKIDIYVFDPATTKFYNVSTYFRPPEIEYTQANIRISLDNAAVRINQQMGISTSPMNFLVSIMG